MAIGHDHDLELDEKQAFDQQFDQPAEASGGAVGLAELALGVVALFAWFIFFAGGILVGTGPYREKLGGAVTLGEWLQAFVIVVLFWTVTNVGILSCIAAFLGAVGSRTRFTVRVMHNEHADFVPSNFSGVAVFYLSAVMRGFGIFSLSFAGLLLLATEAFTEPDQSGYLRLAATLSVISFYAGYDPETFAGLLDRVKKFFEGK